MSAPAERAIRWSRGVRPALHDLVAGQPVVPPAPDVKRDAVKSPASGFVLKHLLAPDEGYAQSITFWMAEPLARALPALAPR